MQGDWLRLPRRDPGRSKPRTWPMTTFGSSSTPPSGAGRSSASAFDRGQCRRMTLTVAGLYAELTADNTDGRASARCDPGAPSERRRPPRRRPQRRDRAHVRPDSGPGLNTVARTGKGCTHPVRITRPSRCRQPETGEIASSHSTPPPCPTAFSTNPAAQGCQRLPVLRAHLSLRHIPPDRGRPAWRQRRSRFGVTTPGRIRDIDRASFGPVHTRVIRNTPAANRTDAAAGSNPAGHAANDQCARTASRRMLAAPSDGTILGRATVVPRLLRLHRQAVLECFCAGALVTNDRPASPRNPPRSQYARRPGNSATREVAEYQARGVVHSTRSAARRLRPTDPDAFLPPPVTTARNGSPFLIRRATNTGSPRRASRPTEAADRLGRPESKPGPSVPRCW